MTHFVEVGGTGRRQGPLMWGQRLLWNDAQWLGGEDHYFNLARNVPVPSGRSTEEALACIKRLVDRHEVLRSRIVVADDGVPLQEVPADSRMTIAVETATPASAAEAEASLQQRMQGRSFRFPGDWPVRFAILTVEESPRAVVVVLSHTAVDGIGATLLCNELSLLLDQGAECSLEPVPVQPLDRAAFEQSPAGRRLSAQSLARMELQLRKVPQTMFSMSPRAPDQPRFKRMELRSPALREALRRVATDLDVQTSSVLVAGVAVMLGVLTGNESVVLKTVLSNRGFPELRALISVTLSNGLFVLDVQSGTFAQLVRAAADDGLRIMVRSQSDPVELDAMVDRLNNELGIAVDLSAFINDFRIPAAELPASGANLSDLARRTTTAWVGEWERQNAKFFLHTASGEAFDPLYLLVDTSFVPSTWVAPLLLGLERLIMEAAHGEVLLSEAPSFFAPVLPPTRDTEWRLVAGNWVHLPEVLRVLSEVVKPAPSEVFEESGDLVAFVATDDPMTDVRGLHQAVVRALPGHPTAIAPRRYVICATPPSDLTDRTAWDRAPVRCAGTGRPGAAGTEPFDGA